MAREKDKPCGTLAELEKYGISPTKQACCCAPNVRGEDGERRIGCPAWKECSRSPIKKLRLKGPENALFRIVKQNGTAREGYGSCFDVVRQWDNTRVRDDQVFEIIGLADGKATVDLRGSVPYNKPDGTVAWEDKVWPDQVVPKFERLGQSPETANEEYMRRVRERAAGNIQTQKIAEFLELEPGDDPDEVETASAGQGTEASG